MRDPEASHLVGCCGLYCGLCSKYQSEARTRCVGCKLGEQHSWCSIWNCCVRKRGFETCAECDEVFSCEMFSRRRVAEWIPAAGNLKQIKEIGLDKWLGEQRERQALLEGLLQDYNDGRSMSFYCTSCARVPVELIRMAVERANKELGRAGFDQSDLKSRAKVLKGVIKDLALKAKVPLD